MVSFLRFCHNNSHHPNRAFLAYHRKIRLLQKNIKLFLKYSWMKYSIMNFQWSIYEEKEARVQRSIEFVKTKNLDLAGSKLGKNNIGKLVLECCY